MRVENSIHIDASLEKVWAVTQDVESWPVWTPTVTSVRLVSEGGLRRGAIARIKQPLQPESEWHVTEFIAGRRFAWETRRAGLRMTGTHDLSAANGGTRNVLSVEASGALALLLWPILRVAVTNHMAIRGLAVHDLKEESTSTTTDLIGEIGVVYGRTGALEWGRVTVGAGVAGVALDTCPDDDDSCFTLGIPLVAEVSRSSRIVGAGVQAFGNINGKASYGGAVLFVQFGRLR